MASFSGEYFDYYQEIARSAFADMLHDHERNHKYYLALKKAIDKMHERGVSANVLDIGTGTAILAMMAVKCGADTVTACEAFRPMADAAERIIEHNGMGEAIRVIKKRSTDIRVGTGADDLWQRANILVTEVFDTELIGEGAIETFNAAHLHLLESDCIVVPDSATVYIQTVESPLAWGWNQPKCIANLDGEVLLRTPTEISECKGTAELHDIQLNQFPTSQFREIVPATPVFEFDFSGKSLIPKAEAKQVPVQCQANGSAQAFFMWWILKMDQEGDIRISCAPHWAHEDYERLKCERPNQMPIQNVIPWRDHWMQAVFYNPKVLHVIADEPLELRCLRDEFSLWFELMRPNSNVQIDEVRPMCTCGFHLAFSRTRIGQMNDNVRTKKFLRILENEISERSTVLFVSDGSLIGLMLAALNARHVYLLDSHKYTRQLLQMYIDFNQLKNVSLIADVNDDRITWNELTHIIGEPNFSTAIVPFDNFRFGDVIDQISNRISGSDVKILPKSATIEAIPIECLDLYKIIAPFGNCESFDLTIFDKIIENSHQMTDALIEAQPLWEYPNKALGHSKTIYGRDFTKKSDNSSTSTLLTLETAGSCNAVAFWTTYNFADNADPCKVFSTGPVNEIVLNSLIDWDMYTRQAIHLYWKPIESKPSATVHIPCTVKHINDNGAGASELSISLSAAATM